MRCGPQRTEWKSLKEGRNCGLAPYLDGNGDLRAYGRIDAALCIPYRVKRPVILSHRQSHGDDRARCPRKDEASKSGC